MRPFTTLRAIAAPMPVANVNTDDIFPSLRGPSTLDPASMGARCFANWRLDDNDQPDPKFILNRSPWDKAQILVSGANFGCGSAREAAAWTLDAVGIRCIITPSFNDVFRTNCFKNGLLPVELEEDQVDGLLELIEDAEHAELDVDLVAQTVTDVLGRVYRFTIDPYARNCLLEGADEIEMTLRKMPRLMEYEAQYLDRRPWLNH
jgi:3-isopropylmalate/(R)-2-methylmalate dehydratase small subunit